MTLTCIDIRKAATVQSHTVASLNDLIHCLLELRLLTRFLPLRYSQNDQIRHAQLIFLDDTVLSASPMM